MKANDLLTLSAVGERQNEGTTDQLSHQEPAPSPSHLSASGQKPSFEYDELTALNHFLVSNGFPPKKRKAAVGMPQARKNDGIFTLGELLDRPSTEVPQLVAPFLPRKGLAMLVGCSDTGKSSLLRQLALAVVMGDPEFLGFPVQAVHRSVICVSTEDNDDAIVPLLKMQLFGQTVPSEARERLRFMFNTDDLLIRLDDMLTERPADLVVVDALGDLFEGNMNQSNEVRRFVSKYNDLAIKHSCLMLFMHHTSKRSEDREPSKNNVLGSQGLEAKMRVVLELRADPYNRELRHLCVLKGNYLASELKEKSYVLRFDKNLRFHNTGEQQHFAELVKGPEQSANEREFWTIARELLEAGHSYEEATKSLELVAKRLGVPPVSKAKLNRRLPKPAIHPTVSPSQPPSDEMVRHPATDGAMPAKPFTDDDVKCLFVSGNILTAEKLLAELQAQHGGDPVWLFAQLQREHRIEPAPSNSACWRITSLAS